MQGIRPLRGLIDRLLLLQCQTVFPTANRELVSRTFKFNRIAIDMSSSNRGAQMVSLEQTIFQTVS